MPKKAEEENIITIPKTTRKKTKRSWSKNSNLKKIALPTNDCTPPSNKQNGFINHSCNFVDVFISIFYIFHFLVLFSKILAIFLVNYLFSIIKSIFKKKFKTFNFFSIIFALFLGISIFQISLFCLDISIDNNITFLGNFDSGSYGLHYSETIARIDKFDHVVEVTKQSQNFLHEKENFDIDFKNFLASLVVSIAFIIKNIYNRKTKVFFYCFVIIGSLLINILKGSILLSNNDSYNKLKAHTNKIFFTIESIMLCALL